MKPSVNQSKSGELSELVKDSIRDGIKRQQAQHLARLLGCHVINDSISFLIWHTDIETAQSVEIELYLPSGDLLFDKPEQHASMTYYRFPLHRNGAFGSVMIDSLPAGNMEQFGAFYQFKLTLEDGSSRVIRDPMAWSMPYGIYAPAEVYDVKKVLSSRKDTSYYKSLEKEFKRSGDNRITPSVNLLEVHTASATLGGTLSSLTKRYHQITDAIRSGDILSPDEQNLLGFDAIELMPIDPVIEHPENHQFWKPIQQPSAFGEDLTVRLIKPSVTNWGYDIVVFGSAALNASILSTGRPHELLELIETLHNFPEHPIKVVLDVVYGHADNQALDLLPESFLSGPNIYGQDVNFRHPIVREMILEMQRRKMNWGFDGIRVDAAQDFKYYDAGHGKLHHDDEFLNRMSEVEQEVAGVTYKPWMIFEDGRPWPRDDWKLASTYREITEMQKHPYQWSPIIFSYNTPYNYTYWVSKWWRIRELLRYGDKWISGYANHDTVRRGTQTDPKSINVNTQLGNSLKMVMDNAYNNPSTTLLMNGFLPGVPMDFVQALGSTPWSFIRNTDTTYALKVAAEEAFFTDWQITEVEYRNPRFFRRLKDIGFRSLHELRRFAKTLLKLVESASYQPEIIARLLNSFEPPFSVTSWSEKELNQYTEAWMADLHEYCNADMHADYIDPKKASFNLSVRQFRLKNRWLNQSFKSGDILSYTEPVDGSVIFYGYRKNPEQPQELIFVANMEGRTKQIDLTGLDLPIRPNQHWDVVLSTPTVKARNIAKPIRLSISQGLLFQKTD